MKRMKTMTGHCVSEKVASMLRELQSDMADMVESGEMTSEEANEWVNSKADQWAGGGSRD